jgi:hypothetical protein
MTNSSELTDRQQELLLQGLRYVKSSIALEPRDWTPDVDADRQRRYVEISELESTIRGFRQTVSSK